MFKEITNNYFSDLKDEVSETNGFYRQVHKLTKLSLILFSASLSYWLTTALSTLNRDAPELERVIWFFVWFLSWSKSYCVSLNNSPPPLSPSFLPLIPSLSGRKALRSSKNDQWWKKLWKFIKELNLEQLKSPMFSLFDFKWEIFKIIASLKSSSSLKLLPPFIIQENTGIVQT